MVSGDLLKDVVIIWMCVVFIVNLGLGLGLKLGLVKVDILWEMVSDVDFVNVISSGIVEVKVIYDFIVKVDVVGFSLVCCYFYCFKSVNNISFVGEICILFEVDVFNVMFGIFFCFNYFVGFFIFYMEVVKDDNIDYVLYFGDYIYEYDGEGYVIEYVKEIGRIYVFDNDIEFYIFIDYCNCYVLYCMDEGLLVLY